MKLLLLLLPFCWAIQIQSKEISLETRAELTKEFGVDPEVIKSRFQKISEKATKQLEEEHEMTISSRFSEELPIVHIDEPIGKNSLDIAELNEREGIADYLFEGDMILTEEQMRELEREVESGGRKKRQAPTFAKKWIDNTVYFYFHNSINQRKRDSVHEALRYIQSHTCINFVEDSNAKNRIMVFNGTGCDSNTGMKGGQQILNLGDGCETVGTVAHEFIHALGFSHEQSRSDRNEYITVNEDNIENGNAHNFARLWHIHDDNYTPYEYGSIMHYSADSMAKKNTLSMVPKDIRYLYTMGHRQISFYDIQMINEHYGCTANCNVQTSAKCQNGGVPNPRDCSKCNCPAGYSGDFCDQRPSGCGESLTATSDWQRGFLRVGDSGRKETKIDNDYCTSWITAPKGKTIEVKINNMLSSQCNYGCFFNGFEIKGESDTRKTNPVFCCKEFLDTVVTSSLNPTPVMAYSNFGQVAYLFLYRYVDEPIKTTTSAPSTAHKTTCEDATPKECENFVKMARGCQEILERKARQYCAKSCGYCDAPSPSTCEDKSPKQCAQLSRNGVTCEQLQSSSYAGFCDKTCGLCGAKNTTVAPKTTKKTTTTPRCEDKMPKECAKWIESGQTCEQLKGTVAEGFCDKTCGICMDIPTTTVPPTIPCEDKQPNACAMYFNAGRTCEDLEETRFSGQCNKSCGLCNGAPTTTMAPKTTKKTTTAAPTTTEKHCEDEPVCKRWFQLGRTCEELKEVHAEGACNKTCGLCGTTSKPTTKSSCVDKDPKWCTPYVKTNGNCNGLSRGVATTICPLSCGYCA